MLNADKDHAFFHALSEHPRPSQEMVFCEEQVIDVSEHEEPNSLDSSTLL